MVLFGLRGLAAAPSSPALLRLLGSALQLAAPLVCCRRQLSPLPAPPCFACVQLLRDLPWAPAGHQVQTCQLPLAGLLPDLAATGLAAPGQAPQQVAPLPRLQGLAVGRTDGALRVEGVGAGGGSWSLTFDAATGALSSWQVAAGARVFHTTISCMRCRMLIE